MGCLNNNQNGKNKNNDKKTEKKEEKNEMKKQEKEENEEEENLNKYSMVPKSAFSSQMTIKVKFVNIRTKQETEVECTGYIKLSELLEFFKGKKKIKEANFYLNDVYLKYQEEKNISEVGINNGSTIKYE